MLFDAILVIELLLKLVELGKIGAHVFSRLPRKLTLLEFCLLLLICQHEALTFEVL